MKHSKRQRLESAGWRVGDTAEFLGLTPEETAFIELKLALARYFRETRLERGWTQARTAEALGSSQSRVAKMEAGDPSVSVDLLVRSLLALGASTHQLGEVISRAA